MQTFTLLWLADYQGNDAYLYTSVLFLDSASMVIARDYTDEVEVVRLMTPLFQSRSPLLGKRVLKVLKETGSFESVRKLTLEEAYAFGWPGSDTRNAESGQPIIAS